jgi:hypothetical protein
MFGLGKSNTKELANDEGHKALRKPDLKCWVTYWGGHKAYTKQRTTRLHIFADHIEIGNPKLKIPFASVLKVEYTKTPSIGLTHNSTKTFTVIEYNDGSETQQIVLLVVDQLGSRNLEKTQAMLYERMQAAKKQQPH